ncbi:hypothetical protein LU631_07440 [Erwinia tracheiphila]|uniref:Membrane protein n=1 Tax=Erwinia tracheiphila TaxID=65700 RepID=A0A0M2KK50_9GAMM|nr:hypothetical protein [Erwinia tracheiphila]EOS93051.1 hypothetical protein ETR_21132 [Erwinia tracheiphila PSU-1]KKF35869.1 membrane protein [Erwinia tracheiphila]KKF37692.1 membrane protein [Erwinia tracheiphila]UIA87187.1 hypothetical protein LU631_20835 [Erwinia tracheiphila]UIA89088.1 hypothetical protein LU631_07440 [Erwinia tracheiphila]
MVLNLKGRAARVALLILSMLLLMAGMFAVASVFMAYDPDGHLTRNWLHDSRWWLFAWRLTFCTGLAAVWLCRVRPRVLRRWPQVRSRLPRTEALAVLFILATEYVAWSGAA